MEGHFAATREELYHVQMEVKHVQQIQNNHTDRILRLEKRQADDAALKSVWNSPFPSVMGGTPQHGLVHAPSANVFEDFDDEEGQNLLGSLHIDAEEEPVRRGASRANSVRFDVSALHGANWASAGSRSSGEFGPVRPNSGLGSHPIERSSSHKSDGRHSSAGHSIHSGRTSSLGLDTNFLVGTSDDDSSVEIPDPPPGLFILGSVPSIIRCWLNQNFSHSALIYADVCTGSQKSTLEYGLLKDLGMLHDIQRSSAGRGFIRLPIYLPEAVVTQPSSRANSPAPHLPTLTATFEVVDTGRTYSDRIKSIRVFIGSDTLRAHNADLLFSQNVMTLYGDDRIKLTVPFVRPEDDEVFKNICTRDVLPDRVELKATAIPFKPGEAKTATNDDNNPSERSSGTSGKSSGPDTPAFAPTTVSEDHAHLHSHEAPGFDLPSIGMNAAIEHQEVQEFQDENHRIGEGERRDTSGIWGSWRSGGLSAGEADSNRESFQRSGRGGRSMKVLKPSKIATGRSTSAARTGSSYEPPAPRVSGDSRRKSQGGLSDINGGLRWDAKKPMPQPEDKTKEPRLVANVSKSSNPVGGASAFAWMNPARSKSGTTAAN